MGLLSRALSIGEGKQLRIYEKRLSTIAAFEPELELETDDELRERFAGLREEAQGGRSLDDLLPETFAIVREMSKRVLGMRHFDVQTIGGQVLDSGTIAEMR
nr:preprotein translocase subunit SecA [Patulibacter sp.]